MALPAWMLVTFFPIRIIDITEGTGAEHFLSLFL